MPDHDAAEFLSARGTSAAEVIVTTLASLDVAGELRRGGLADQDLAQVRSRLS